MTAYVYSIAAAPGSYIVYEPKLQGQQTVARRIQKRITIKGGCGVAHAQRMDGHNFDPDSMLPPLVTPKGAIITSVTDEEMEMLKKNKNFMQAVEKGYLSFEEGKKVSVEKKLNTMMEKDDKGPLTKEGFKTNEMGKPKDKRLEVPDRKYQGVVAQPTN